MAITAELQANILRYYHVEKWRVGTIARQLHIHHSVVTRVLQQAGVPKTVLSKRPSSLDPYLPFVLETLKKHPTLTARRLYEMIRERGYTGSVSHCRHWVALHRPKPHAQAYLRLRTLPAEQAQVDWGHFGTITIGKAVRPLSAFVMVLSFSRKIFLRFYLSQRMPHFLQGHEAAFNAYNGVPRVLLYDNLKQAVLERQGDAIRFHPTLLEFAAHYRFEPRPVAVARGNEKGRVERAIRYVRDNFFAARVWKDLEDLNAQAATWCEHQASHRPCPEDKTLSVQEVFLQEQPKLITLPDNPYPTFEREEVSVAKTPYVRFDGNDYSVPHTHVCRLLTVIATQDTVSILDNTHILAEHPRSYDKSQQIEQAAHLEALVENKRQARFHRGQDRLTHVLPSGATFLKEAAARGYSLKSITKQLLQLLEDYGATELEAALLEAISRDVPHPNTVRLSLERRREQRSQPPLIPLRLPDDKRVRELSIRPHPLTNYDPLQSTTSQSSEKTKEDKKHDNR